MTPNIGAYFVKLDVLYNYNIMTTRFDLRVYGHKLVDDQWSMFENDKC